MTTPNASLSGPVLIPLAPTSAELTASETWPIVKGLALAMESKLSGSKNKDARDPDIWRTRSLAELASQVRGQSIGLGVAVKSNQVGPIVNQAIEVALAAMRVADVAITAQNNKGPQNEEQSGNQP